MIARAGFAVAALIALTGAAKPSAPPVLTIVATDFAFTVPGGANATVPAGPVTLRLVNHGKEIHMMGVVLLGNTTAAEFIQTFSKGGFVGTEVGGVNGIAPGGSGTSTVILKPGNALIACYITSADGKMHVLKGMFAPLHVTEGTGQMADEPHTSFDIALNDYRITVPNGLRAGAHVFRVDNDGAVTHDLESQLVQLLVEHVPAEVRAEAQSGLINGPVIKAEGRSDVVTNQQQVDDLLESLGF